MIMSLSRSFAVARLLTAGAAVAVLASGCAKTPPDTSLPGGGTGGASADAAVDAPKDAVFDLATAPLAGTVTLPLAGAHDIQPLAFGQNYWNWEPTWGNAVNGTEGLVKAAGVRVIRSGGANNEIETPDPFSNTQLDQFVAYCKAAGAEPLLQVSLVKNAAGAPATAADAAAMVTYANVTMGYGIKYWSIGNEPDLYTTQSLQPATYAATDYCTTFRAYVTAMKAADPSIHILGPELSWKYVTGTGNDWLTPFLDGCKDVVDVVSVHRYPFAPAQATMAGALGDASAYRQVVRMLRKNLDGHGMTATPLAITEEHITYDGTPALSTMTASPQTFYAGLWAADVMGVALEENLWTGAFWHIADSASGWKLAFIIGTTPAPTYYAMKTVATNFSGKMLVPTGVPAGFSVYASRDDAAAKTVVMVLNKTGSPARLALAFDTGSPEELGFPAESLTLVTFSDGTPTPALLRYTKDLADAGLPPAVVQ
jgi:hypothetical protein